MFSTTHPEHFAQIAAKNRQRMIMADIVEILLELDGIALDYEIYMRLYDRWADYEFDVWEAFGWLQQERWIYIVRKRE